MPDTADLRILPDRRYNAQQLFELQSRALRGFAPPPADLAGRGIVTAAHDRVIAPCWVLLSEIARLGVPLPVELWHRPGELSARHREILLQLPLDLTVRELADEVSGYAVKPVAVWRSRFRHVLWLDADNAPLRDPAFLFEDPEYAEKGSLFWRDTSGAGRARFWHAKSPVWPVFGVPPNDAEEHETGQLLIDKVRCWPELCLTAYYAFNQKFFYQFGIGDKDTFRLAWQRVARERGRSAPARWYHADPSAVPYGMMPYGPFHLGRPNKWGAWGGGTVLQQRDRAGRPLFNHRNTEKFRLDAPNPFNADVPNEERYHDHVAALAQILDPVLDPARDPVSAGRPPPEPSAPAWPDRPCLPCAWGDAFDRLTILRIKRERVSDPAKRANVVRELEAVEAAIGPPARFPAPLAALVDDLAAVNAALWDTENAIRDRERAGTFDAAFVALARTVYRDNAERARIKRAVNDLLGSALVEEKAYAPTA